MSDELSAFIDEVYRESYSLLKHNCIHKSLKIKAKAEAMGIGADLVACISIVPIKKWHDFPTVNFHLYVLIDGRKVDVSLDPLLEEKYCKNKDKRLVMPVNISRLNRRAARCPLLRLSRNIVPARSGMNTLFHGGKESV